MSKKTGEKVKHLITVYSPPYFGGREIGTILASDPSRVVGRVIRTDLYQLTGDPSKHYLLIYFKIVGVEDSSASTIFYGHEYGREFLRSLVRRGSTKVDGIFDVTTKDGFHLRLTITAFTINRIRRGKERKIRHIMKEIVTKAGQSLTLEQFSQEMVLGKSASDIFNSAKKIALFRHVGVVKSKVLKIPEWVYSKERLEELAQGG
ncbi:MAG: 30S ribosomal protein S3ae [Candidatus Terraquivivens tikiterensis]|uniref:Small ribosomal subunit protein eS1 n=1 Tax=Candidatus Terraquivivens tikiterensis TaxID=1980982 RepID=A0A2R7Y1M3_9ARCH|nr:MAG: 30S ribosomal protein S3ae [Candidatus Terraquivivens tikiterensis]